MPFRKLNESIQHDDVRWTRSIAKQWDFRRARLYEQDRQWIEPTAANSKRINKLKQKVRLGRSLSGQNAAWLPANCKSDELATIKQSFHDTYQLKQLWIVSAA